MDFINIAVLEKDKDKVVDTIIESGAVHLEQAEKINTFIKDEKNIHHNIEEIDIKKLKSKIDILIEAFQTKPKIENPEEFINKTNETDIYNEIENTDKLLSKYNEINNKIKDIDATLFRYNQMIEQIHLLKSSGGHITKFSKYQFLEFRMGEIKADYYKNITEDISTKAAVIFPIKTTAKTSVIYIIYLKKDRAYFESLLNKYGFNEIEFFDEIKNVSGDILAETKEKIKHLQDEKNQYLESLERLKKENISYIKDIYFKVKILDLKNRVNKYFVKTSKVFIISGWIPKDSITSLIKLLKSLVGKSYYIEVIKAKEIKGKEDIPVIYKNPKILKPFEDLTYTYGTPAYKTINPTPILALTYLIMFGVMFGDMGHGLVLLLSGILLRYIRKVGESYKSILTLLSYCGISSIIFGALFGSIFGYENIIKPIWLRPMDSINKLFGVAIIFGVSVITIGIIINIINSVITRDFVQGIFSKSGLIGGIVYWGIIIIVSKAFVLKESPTKSLYFIFFWIPIILLFLKDPLIKIFSRRQKVFKDGVVLYIMENLVDVLELFIGYISNTMSFIRVVAFGLAHTGLFIAVFSLVDILNRAGASSFLSILVLILGNIGIILLESLVVSIQAVRLEYYEFFDKFFIKTGKPYKPISIMT